MPPSEARELKQLHDENTKLKRLVAGLSIDKRRLAGRTSVQISWAPCSNVLCVLLESASAVANKTDARRR